MKASKAFPPTDRLPRVALSHQFPVERRSVIRPCAGVAATAIYPACCIFRIAYNGSMRWRGALSDGGQNVDREI